MLGWILGSTFTHVGCHNVFLSHTCWMYVIYCVITRNECCAFSRLSASVGIKRWPIIERGGEFRADELRKFVPLFSMADSESGGYRMLRIIECFMLQGSTRIVFQPYTHKQLIRIVQSRLEELDVFDPDAVQFVARKVCQIIDYIITLYSFIILYCHCFQ